MAITIDLDRLTLADYPALVRVVKRIMHNPLDPDAIEEALPLLDRVIEGGTASIPLSALSEVRRAFVVAAAGMLYPKRSGGNSGQASGSARVSPRSNISPSHLPGEPTAGTERS